jgi:hypothetical protein
VAEPGNGWRSGRDPVQRVLRVDPTRRLDAVPTLALALAAALLLLGYESVVRIPGIDRKDRDE